MTSLTSTPADENVQFSLDERARIARSLTEIREYLIKTHTLTEYQRIFITERLAYLQEASERLSRKDWIAIAVGVITSIIIQVALPPDTARELLRFVATTLDWLLKAPGLLP